MSPSSLCSSGLRFVVNREVYTERRECALEQIGSRWPELNRRPTPYHGVALPTELQRQNLSSCAAEGIFLRLKFFRQKIWPRHQLAISQACEICSVVQIPTRVKQFTRFIRAKQSPFWVCFARPKGFEPSIYPVTGDYVNRYTTAAFEILPIYNRVPVDGIGPSFKAYESFVLPLNYTG